MKYGLRTTLCLSVWWSWWDCQSPMKSFPIISQPAMSSADITAVSTVKSISRKPFTFNTRPYTIHCPACHLWLVIQLLVIIKLSFLCNWYAIMHKWLAKSKLKMCWNSSHSVTLYMIVCEYAQVLMNLSIDRKIDKIRNKFLIIWYAIIQSELA
jgi:hypothetical protein